MFTTLPYELDFVAKKQQQQQQKKNVCSICDYPSEYMYIVYNVHTA